MGSPSLLFLFLAVLAFVTVDCSYEGDVLYAWKIKLEDPNNVLKSWDSSLANPCTWSHVTCNSNNNVTRVDLGNAGLSGPLIPDLGNLTFLQYFEVFENKINGSIPSEIGKLLKLVSLDLKYNHLSGFIPESLGNLTSLRFMRLNHNNLTGTVPKEIFQLIGSGNLWTLDLSDNDLNGTVRATNPIGFAITTVIQDPKA
ncbi:hypothetical protein VitviT2T_001587 [Vitis vinifera]|uniref:Leucine-rich repeat-containing N-terminal plant-type domain-containing protein n=3 Tax=Vitis vinifera TaxID=29760 RepID=A0ABY9BG03_VITVI|nr:leucine-rich repeat protein 1 [Vitis vinifera]RVW31988.1 Leucine-rich repeat protein 1 [Vitis vinifera]WJZ81765.1 hypothetical protein VitviT2T_001587 [Vitis vinifera]|eukprot:XP_002263654.2 PREDICTED: BRASSINOSTEROID INSENSITIVE 1-associated receptor kinase 1 [Vitis vinifera]